MGASLTQKEERPIVGRPCEVCGGGHVGQRDRGARAGVRLLHVHGERLASARVGRERQPGAVGRHLRHMVLGFMVQVLGLQLGALLACCPSAASSRVAMRNSTSQPGAVGRRLHRMLTSGCSAGGMLPIAAP